MILCSRKHSCFQRRFRSKESGKKNRMIPKKVGVRNHENGSLIDCRMKYDHDSRESSIMMKNKKGFSQAQLKWKFCGKKVLAVVAVAVAVEAKFAFFPISSNREVLPNKWHFQDSLEKMHSKRALRCCCRRLHFSLFRFSWYSLPSFCWRPLATMGSG